MTPLVYSTIASYFMAKLFVQQLCDDSLWICYAKTRFPDTVFVALFFTLLDKWVCFERGL